MIEISFCFKMLISLYNQLHMLISVSYKRLRLSLSSLSLSSLSRSLSLSLPHSLSLL